MRTEYCPSKYLGREFEGGREKVTLIITDRPLFGAHHAHIQIGARLHLFQSCHHLWRQRLAIWCCSHLELMSGATPTLVRREFKFPPLVPKPPQPHPIPLPPRRGPNVYGNLNQIRDLQREMDDLSDEETELEELVRLT